VALRVEAYERVTATLTQASCAVRVDVAHEEVGVSCNRGVAVNEAVLRAEDAR
jgi:hypothetical protein